MSQTLGQALTAWQVVLATLRRKSVSWRGAPLSERDMHTYTEAIVLCALHLTDLSSRFAGIGSYRDLVAWAHFVCTLDVSQVGSFLSDAITLLRHVSQPTSYSWFKRQLQEEYPFVGMFLNPIKGTLQSFLECPSPQGFSPCYQFLSFLTHLSLQDIVLDLEGEYEELEAYLRTLHYPVRLLREMNDIMREWMKDFSVNEENFFPKHGPGSTVEVSRADIGIRKYQFLGTDPLIDYVFEKFAGVCVSSYYPREPIRFERKSELVYVPKSMKTRRTISKEPSTLQYLQQGVARVLVDYIHNHPVLGRHIDLRSQEKNGTLAIESSADHKFSTIDLSMASDCVTLTLVKAVFRGTPLLPFLVALRSHTVVLPSGKELRVEKFAPMGSALCFPIETLIFSCIVELAARHAHRYGLGLYQTWRVYGDDIIVQSGVYEDVTRLLEVFGFIPNLSKSFSSCDRFRESCGEEGYDGIDVTPMRISRRFVSSPKRWTSSHAAAFSGHIDLANSCEVYGFRLTRAWVIRGLLDGSSCPPLFSETGHGSVYSSVPDNYRAPWRLSPRKRNWYQREEIQVRRTVSRRRNTACKPADEDLRLFEWLRLASQRQDDITDLYEPICVPGRPSVDLLSCVWVDNPTPRLPVGALKSECADNNGWKRVTAQ